jgi:hypothetical protein
VIYIRCIRFNTNQERNSVRDTIKNGAKDLSVLIFGAPDTVRCTRAVQIQTSHSREFRGALRYNSPGYPVCHRTVRWASGATAPCAPMVDYKTLQCGTVPRQKSERRDQRSLDCPVQQKDKRIKRSTASNRNGRADVARSGQWTVTVWWSTGLSGAPISSSLCQRLGIGGYKYPPTTSFIGIQVFRSSHSIQDL